jgi:ABC-2 type transport system ATP-binding protein
MPNPPVIELQGLEVKFGGRPILKGLNASLSGRCIGLLGPNGAGKTTLLHTLLGFHPPSAGTARIFGKDIKAEAREIRGLMGYMPESDAFIGGMTGVRFVRLMGEISGLPAERALERAHE